MTAPQDRYLIVNADDLGLSAETNRGIFEAHRHGVVTSASLMVMQSAAADALAASRQFPRLSIGLHVDLAEAICERGDWHQAYERVPLDDPNAVESELRKQLAQFRQSVGRDPTHLDSHQNLHHRPALRPVFRRVARELSIPLRGFDPRVQHCGRFYGRIKDDIFPEGITVANLCRIINELTPGITELSCHPGCDATLVSQYAKERLQEVEVLCNPRVRVELARANVTLVSFADFATIAG